jgi:hypothetical protein
MTDFAPLDPVDQVVKFPLLRADPHKWGRGAIHLIDEERDQTRCGKSPGACPGTKFWGTQQEITCKTCLASIEAEKRREQERQEWQQREQQWKREREARQQEWWRLYNAYLLTPTWRNKRMRVLERAGGRCEGCGEQRAVQVHHRRYPQDCRPGSREWITREKLFDLIAICEGCHDDVHQ